MAAIPGATSTHGAPHPYPFRPIARTRAAPSKPALVPRPHPRWTRPSPCTTARSPPPNHHHHRALHLRHPPSSSSVSARLTAAAARPRALVRSSSSSSSAVPAPATHSRHGLRGRARSVTGYAAALADASLRAGTLPRAARHARALLRPKPAVEPDARVGALVRMLVAKGKGGMVAEVMAEFAAICDQLIFPLPARAHAAAY